MVRHSGGKQGYRSAVAFNPNTGIGAVVLANARTDDRPMNIALHLVTRAPISAAPRAPGDRIRVEVAEEELDRYAGRYRLPDGEELEVARNGTRLVVRYPSNAVLELLPTGSREFFYNGGNDDIAFEVNPSGAVTDLVLYGDGKWEGDGQFALRVTQSR